MGSKSDIESMWPIGKQTGKKKFRVPTAEERKKIFDDLRKNKIDG
jgi:hypothetical protein